MSFTLKTKGLIMLKEDLKAIFDEIQLTTSDAQLDTIAKRFEKTVPYDRLKEKVDEFNTLKESYDKSVASAESVTKERDLLKVERDSFERRVNDLTSYKDKFDAIQKSENDSLIAKHSDKMKLFDITEKDSRFSKVSKIKDKLTIPKDGEELSIEDISRNLELISIAEDTGLFETVGGSDTTAPAPSVSSPSVELTPVQAFANKSLTK